MRQNSGSTGKKCPSRCDTLHNISTRPNLNMVLLLCCKFRDELDKVDSFEDKIIETEPGQDPPASDPITSKY